MNDKGETRDDLRIPEGELGQKIKDEFGKEDITVIVSRHKFYGRVFDMNGVHIKLNII